jgi:tripartite-type tricarboxylate transporter receptor subunit TctC
MTLPRRKFLQLAGAAATTSAFSCGATAQTTYPSRPITVIVPFAAGGTQVLCASYSRSFRKGLERRSPS